MFYVFDGDDTFSCREELAALIAKMGDPATAELNTTYLDGSSTDLNEIRHHCSTLPFLSDRRLVIVREWLEHLWPKRHDVGDPLLNELLAFLVDLPPTARLIFWETKVLPRTHPVLALAKDHKLGHVRTFRSPTGSALARWVRGRVKRMGGEIESEAASALCDFVGSDLYRLDQETQKLFAYTGGQRPISVSDVHLLTPDAREASVFGMVDSLGLRDGKTASRIYHQLLDEGAHPLVLLGMITRQFRLMCQVKELAGKLGTPEAIARELGQKPYPITKILAQSKNYSPQQLNAVYHKLLDTDVDIKTGRLDPVLALDTLIAGLSKIP
jgi:DNA polymerase-3 subunit delta